MAENTVYAVLMAGGVGSRFWPLSRRKRPKQLLSLFSADNMIALTTNRLQPLIKTENIYVVTNSQQLSGITRALPNIPADNLIAEPFGRNTAPCIGLAAMHIDMFDPEGVMVVLPADHLIKNEERFRENLAAGIAYAMQTGDLVTLGIKPNYPETGYGYIQSGEKVHTQNGIDIYKVKTFAEKPNYETAKRFLQSGDFSWNSGMFIWSVASILQEFEEHMPELFDGLTEIRRALGTSQQDQVTETVYKTLRKVSIDYGIMEQSERVVTIAGDFGWNDVGSWDVVFDLKAAESDTDNVCLGDGDTVLIDANNNLVHAGKDKLVSLVNIDDMIVVASDDAVLICPRGNSQRVKEVVEALEKKGGDRHL
jgi:mannose-1-phosphate guanylyltransferase